MNTRSETLITAAELAEQLAREQERDQDQEADTPRTRVLDVRWTLPQPNGRPLYESGHIPTAVYVDLDTQLAEHGTPRDGRHPLPSPETFQSAARSWGVNDGDEVVVYDGGGNYASARAWWLLRNAGFERVRLLDGALPAWERAGFELETGNPAVSHGNVTLDTGRLPTIGLSEVAPFVRDGGVLLDARAPERYRGEQEPIDPRAGHIPGALSAPTGENLDKEGLFLSVEKLRERFSARGANGSRPVASYCGSGVTATHNLVALALAGFEGALYPGSWSQWSNHPELPAAVGDTP